MKKNCKLCGKEIVSIFGRKMYCGYEFEVGTCSYKARQIVKQTYSKRAREKSKLSPL